MILILLVGSRVQNGGGHLDRLRVFGKRLPEERSLPIDLKCMAILPGCYFTYRNFVSTNPRRCPFIFEANLFANYTLSHGPMESQNVSSSNPSGTLVY
jgi:hypothetical protein